MSAVMWAEPGGEIRWQPQLPNGKRLWVDRGYTGEFRFDTYWATKPKGKHDTPELYRSYVFANIRAWIGNRRDRKDWKQL